MKQCSITLLIFSSLFAVRPALASVVVPMPTMQLFSHNPCGFWSIQLTYTATLADDSVLEQLSAYKTFGAFAYTNYYLKETSVPLPERLLGGSPIEKLRLINKRIFGVENPALGQQVSKNLIETSRGCPYEDGHIACIGTFVGTRDGYETIKNAGQWPNSFPRGTCIYIPRQSGSCKFDVATSTIDYGVISPGIHNRAVDVPFHCSEPTTFEIHLLNPSGGTTDTVESEHMKSVLSINDQPLPYTSRIDGSSTLSVSALSTIDEQASGHVANAATLRISIE